MDIALAELPFLVSAALAAIMGFAIQRGATCMVAAVDEIVTKRRAVGSSRVDLQACKLEYSIVSPK